MRGRILFAVLAVLCVIAAPALALDYPHFGINNIGCDSCHFVSGTQPSLMPPWTAHTPQDIDDTQYNTLCWSCHNDIDAPYVRTHSSLQTDNSYGDWTVECRVCHDPHYQDQFRKYGSESYLFSGASTNVTSTSITKTGAEWTVDAYAGLVVVPNVLQKNYNYNILSNTSDTLTVKGPVNLTKVTAGNTFAIVYGNLINDTIDLSKITITPAKSGSKTARFFNSTGSKSFADGDVTYDGICEVCHTQTTHFRSNGGGPDQLHANIGAPAGTKCTSCHNHVKGFAHSDGAGGGCDSCHGHDAGWQGNNNYGRGTFQSHSTHTENDADDLRGPNITCSACHDTNNFPHFKTGVDSNGDGKYNLSETDVCNACHSPAGQYDGVNDAVIGAKSNWENGVYDGSDLIGGKENWCAGCHDEVPSVIQSVSAPNVIGDEGAITNYGTGYGFYKTGHGLPAEEVYPWTKKAGSPLEKQGACLDCNSCHDYSMPHIDSLARTYESTGYTGTPEKYQNGYRLKSINGEYPMIIPRGGTGLTSDDFRLCVSCHDTDIMTQNSRYTNFRIVWSPTAFLNDHWNHLYTGSGYWGYPSDWGPLANGGDSRLTCVTCHNVHGSTQLSMITDGRLIGKEPGFPIWYKGATSSPPGLVLPDSVGTYWDKTAVPAFCAGGSCHGGNSPYARMPFKTTPPQITNVYGSEGRADLTVVFSEGVYGSSAAQGGLTPGDLDLTDNDNNRTIVGVTHTAGNAYALLTLSSALDSSGDVGTDTVSAAVYSVFDFYGNAAGAATVVISDNDPALPAPDVTANKHTSTWYGSADIVFTNAAGFGSGGVSYYRYVWDQNTGHTFNGSEAQWSSGTLSKTSAAEGSWYLHVKSYNEYGVGGDTVTYGPFNYDGTPPGFFTQASPTDGAVTANTSPVFTWTPSSDAVSGLSKYQLFIDGILNKDIPPDTISSAPAMPLTSGAHTWYVMVADNAGHQLQTGDWTINIDTTTVIWTTREDFEGNASTTGTATTGSAGIDTASSPGDIRLSAPLPLWTAAYNPSPGWDEAKAITRDDLFIYVAGTDSTPGNGQWRIEKRGLTDGGVIWSEASNPSANFDNVNSITVDGSGVYVAGSDYSPGNSQWRIEKRGLTDGALIWSKVFNPSSGWEEAVAIAVDGTGVYVAGHDNSPGDGQWRIEKRGLTDGGVIWSRVFNPSTSWENISSIAIDGSGVYVAGSDYSSGDGQWRIEKRGLTDGAVIWSQGSNPGPFSDAANALAIDGSGIYAAGSDYSSSDGRWRIEKRSLTDGGLIWYNVSGLNLLYGSLNAIALDGSGVYGVGYDYALAAAQWRIEKRSLIDGSQGWVRQLDPSPGEEYAYAVTVDNSGIYVAGGDYSTGESRWRIEKYGLNFAYGPSGTIGETGTPPVGLRVDTGSGNAAAWSSITFNAAMEPSGSNAVKLAIRTSDDGLTWSQLKGRDGNAIDWATNYFGLVYGGTAYTDLSSLPPTRFLELVVRPESDGSITPIIKDIEINYGP